MRTIPSSRHLLLVLATVLAFAGCRKEPADEAATANNPDSPPPPAQTVPPVEPAAVATAPVTVASITIGTEAAADKSVVPDAAIGAQDPVIVSIRTEGAASNVAVGAKLIYQDGQVAGEQGATLVTDGPETTNIEFRNPAGWPTGSYRAEVMVDGKAAGTPQQFEVK